MFFLQDQAYKLIKTGYKYNLYNGYVSYANKLLGYTVYFKSLKK